VPSSAPVLVLAGGAAAPAADVCGDSYAASTATLAGGVGGTAARDMDRRNGPVSWGGARTAGAIGRRAGGPDESGENRTVPSSGSRA
jgi:hypothetical protein